MSQFDEDILAEIAAVNTAVMACLKQVALSKPDPRAYLSALLDSGLQAMETTNYWSIPPERKADFLENAKARYTDIVTSIRVP